MSASEMMDCERRNTNKHAERDEKCTQRRDLEQRAQAQNQAQDAEQRDDVDRERKRERRRHRVAASRQRALAAVKAAGLRRILRLPEVEAATGKKRSAIYDGMADGTFPKPVPLGERAVGWIESEILAWQEARIAERDKRAERIAERDQATI